METKKYTAGSVIFNKGDVEHCMYQLMSGKVAIYADYGLPTEKKLTTLTVEQGRYFGEMGLVNDAPRSATAVAETDCSILVIGEDQVNEFVLNDPAALLNIVRQMGLRISDLTNDYIEAVKTIAENEKYADAAQKPDWLRESTKKFIELWNFMSRDPKFHI